MTARKLPGGHFPSGQRLSEEGAMKNKAFIAAMILFTLMLSAALLASANSDSIAAARAAQIMRHGDYDRAKELYEKLGDTEHAEACEELIRAQLYTEAQRLLQTGDYSGARELLSDMPEYNEARNLLDCCDWQEAQARTEAGDYAAARRLCLGIPEYPGSAAAVEKLNALLYEEAEGLAQSFELQKAADIWNELGDYGNSELMSGRCLEILDWMKPGEMSVMDELTIYSENSRVSVYAGDIGYFVIPKECGEDTGFVLYYPGGRNTELYLDYFLCYLENPAENAITLFLRRNGLNSMEEKNAEALAMLERVAAEQGLFVHDLVVCGSSLGAYPALHSAASSYRERGIYVPCVLSLDAGGDWAERKLDLSDEECAEAAALGTEFYLYGSIGVGMNRESISCMVNGGLKVTAVGYVYDDHNTITMDALGMGVFDWALGDRTVPHRPDIYYYVPLEPTA